MVIRKECAEWRISRLRFVNRQHGSGTRMLLDLLLADCGVAPGSISGYETAEFTHAAVAAFIASGMADVGFGLETAARRFGLDFIPILRERYFFACEAVAIERPSLRLVLRLMRSTEFPFSGRCVARLRRTHRGDRGHGTTSLRAQPQVTRERIRLRPAEFQETGLSSA